MAISIKNVVDFYAELPTQDKALEILQQELSRLGLSADSCPWAVEFRKQPEAPIAPLGMSIAAKESVRLPYTGVINWQNPRCYVSKYFTVHEVTQGDRRRIPTEGSEVARNVLKLAHELDKIRELWGSPIGITSWWRPALINAQVGGVRNSQHITGAAADIHTMDGRDREFEHWLDKIAWKNRALGFGIASNRGFSHVDLRTGGLRWRY